MTNPIPPAPNNIQDEHYSRERTGRLLPNGTRTSTPVDPVTLRAKPDKRKGK